YSITPSDHVRFFQTLNDVVVAALQCGLTRIAAIFVPSSWPPLSPVPGELWHHDIAHNVPFPETHAQETMIGAQGLFFSDVMLDLVSKLDAIADPAGTLLDRCLVSWTQEAGNLVHETQSLPIVTFGNADGAGRTGAYLDYRNLSQRISPNPDYEGTEGGNKYFGL